MTRATQGQVEGKDVHAQEVGVPARRRWVYAPLFALEGGGESAVAVWWRRWGGGAGGAGGAHAWAHAGDAGGGMGGTAAAAAAGWRSESSGDREVVVRLW